MIVHERLERIRALLAENPRCPIHRIEQELGISRSTVRRDLLRLEAEGAVVRVHGGVVHRGLLQGEPTFDHRSRENQQAKQTIAERACGLVGDARSIFIDAGTTCLEVGRRLLLRKDLVLYTHSLRLMQEACAGGKAEVICLGGSLRRPTEALVGALAFDWLNHLHFDAAFIGASGLSRQDGPSTTEMTEAAVKQAAIARASRAVLIADHSKLDRPAAVSFAGWERFSQWVVDARPKGWLPEGLEVVDG